MAVDDIHSVLKWGYYFLFTAAPLTLRTYVRTTSEELLVAALESLVLLHRRLTRHQPLYSSSIYLSTFMLSIACSSCLY